MTPERYPIIRSAGESAGRTHAEAVIARVTDWTRESADYTPGIIRAPGCLASDEIESFLAVAEETADAAWRKECARHGIFPTAPDCGQAEAKAVEMSVARADLWVARGVAGKKTQAPPRRWRTSRRTA